MAVVETWTGSEASKLRHAMRMTVREFAERLGAAVRTVAMWESKGRTIVPSPVMQAALDTALSQASEDARARFALLMGGSPELPGGVDGRVVTNRREATGGLLALLAAFVATPMDALGSALSHIGARQDGPVDGSLVESHQTWSAAMAAAYRTADPSVLLPLVTGYADSFLTLLDRPMASSERSDLLAVAIGVHSEAGLVAFNAYHWPVSYRYLAVARALADESGDPSLLAQVLGVTSYLYNSALRGGRGGSPHRAIMLLDEALDVAPRSEGLLRAELAAWRADQAGAMCPAP